MMPAAAASAPPSSQVVRMTGRTSTPTTAASAGFSDTARIERPMVVRFMTKNMATTSTDRQRQRQELVGRHADAAADRNGDLELAAEIGRLRGEDEFEQAAQGHRGAEARHHHDDGVAARPQAG